MKISIDFTEECAKELGITMEDLKKYMWTVDKARKAANRKYYLKKKHKEVEKPVKQDSA